MKNMKLFITAILIALAAAVFSTVTGQAVIPSIPNVMVTVYDSAATSNNLFEPTATIYVSDTSNRLVKKVSTKSENNVQFAKFYLNPGTYVISVSAPRYYQSAPKFMKVKTGIGIMTRENIGLSHSAVCMGDSFPLIANEVAEIRGTNATIGYGGSYAKNSVGKIVSVKVDVRLNGVSDSKMVNATSATRFHNGNVLVRMINSTAYGPDSPMGLVTFYRIENY